MTAESKLILHGNKYANIIMSMCELFGISLQKVTDIFYNSETSVLVEDGVADLQCRSDKYLATLVWEKCQECHKDKA